ncbi:ABC transporter permease subunit [Tissierella sp. MB52-C2]|uniref:ABC transporter permease n=1 Tax=Tissierella sp. MB52-C2 TaxID=3070999 RepID=UPI00280B2F58|nr:ABC transporter permease subunit [Tissierella sp. MB52-C2]WMM24626.1 ABC transporter permease subunit [Tissierella sp. MB52-C2]
MNKNNLLFRFITYLFMAFLILPLIVIIIWSFTKIWPWPLIFPKEFGLRGWEYFLDPKNNSLGVLLYSITLSTVVTIITLIISIPAGKALGIYEFKGKKLIEILIFAPIIVPTVAVAMGVHITFLKLGLANTFLGVVLIHLPPCIPYGVRILKNVFEIIGESLELQAKVLGANSFQTFINITLPLIAPGIVSAGTMVFIVSFSQYFLNLLIGGGRVITFSMIMFPFVKSGDRMLGSVYSIVFILTTMVFLGLMEILIKKYYKSSGFY